MLGLDSALRIISETAEALSRESERLATKSPQELIRHYAMVRKVYEQLSDIKKFAGTVQDRLSYELVPDVMRREGVKTINLDNIGRVTVSYKYSCTMLDKRRGIEYLRGNGAGPLVQETVNAQSLAAYSKKLLEDEGKELPADIFKVSTMPYTSITKTK